MAMPEMRAVIFPDARVLRSIGDYRTPETVVDVEKFLELVKPLNHFVDVLAITTAPLSRLVDVRVFEWTPECSAAFREVKSQLGRAEIFAPIGPQFIVSPAMHAIGCAARLMQEDEQGSLIAIAYQSAVFSASEAQFTDPEKWVVTLARAAHAFKDIINGGTAVARVDNHHGCWFAFEGRLTGRLARYTGMLTVDSFVYQFSSGQFHSHAADGECASSPFSDSIARAKALADLGLANELTRAEFRDLQLSDNNLLRCYDTARGAAAGKPYTLCNDLLYFNAGPPGGEPVLKLCVPAIAMARIMADAHAETKCAGSRELVSAIQERFWARDLPTQVNYFRRTCAGCAVKALRHVAPISSFEQLRDCKPTRPFQVIQLTLIEAQAESFHGNKFLLIIACRLTRFAIARPLRSSDAALIGRALQDSVVKVHGSPSYISIATSDRMPDQARLTMYEWLEEHFHTSAEFGAYFESDMFAILQQYTDDLLQRLVEEAGRQWCRVAFTVAVAINAHVNGAIGVTPYFSLYGRESEKIGKFIDDTFTCRCLEKLSTSLVSATMLHDVLGRETIRYGTFSVDEAVLVFRPVVGNATVWAANSTDLWAPARITHCYSTLRYGVDVAGWPGVKEAHAIQIRKLG